MIGWSARFLSHSRSSLSVFHSFSTRRRCTDCLDRESSISDRIYLADGLSDGINLAGLTTSGHAYTDVDIGELVKADDEKGLVDLEAQDCGFDQAEGLSCNGEALEPCSIRRRD